MRVSMTFAEWLVQVKIELDCAGFDHEEVLLKTCYAAYKADKWPEQFAEEIIFDEIR